MYDFVFFVIYSSDEQFYTQYQTYFNIENAVDYFIFLNVARALDNAGNNLFVARYNVNEPYLYSIQSESEIPYRNLNQGIYFIHFQTNDLHKVKKVIVKSRMGD